ncbi:bifunctional non-homologous end joining protein LigD [Pelomonas saccharophila]|uniref:Bifunctional non-homologous end joining protein LigD n=1 Tax=Roseateles saccharophilus TaxID=304 RepID=A0ABU1YKV6_ROSSA|nr:non-homologous end-joining DNA ligase [Roseateles saccharophilus]MDR7268631.1 bifunctional non-homologous end joining protein LigD [Roseateles saccharophilus]
MKLTHAERVVDARSGATKGDVARYYEDVAPLLLPQLRGRPVALLRAPEGVGESTFFQKHAGKTAWPGLRELDPALWPGHEALLEVTTRQALRGAVQMNTLEFHSWNARSANLGKPDRLVLDLDPGEGVAWQAIREAAGLVRDLLLELSLRSWLKTSGGAGLHLIVPLAARWSVDTVRSLSAAIVQRLADEHPQRLVAKSGAANRVGRIYVDWLRNGEGATAVAAYSLRARPGLGVAMPIGWEELPSVSGAAHWTLANAREHLAARSTAPWADLAAHKQSLAAALQALA